MINQISIQFPQADILTIILRNTDRELYAHIGYAWATGSSYNLKEAVRKACEEAASTWADEWGVNTAYALNHTLNMIDVGMKVEIYFIGDREITLDVWNADSGGKDPDYQQRVVFIEKS